MLVDANVLLYAVDRGSPLHDPARAWFDSAMAGATRVGLPWQSIGAFVRIATNPRTSAHPLAGEEAWSHVAEWLAARNTWIPPATERTAALLGDLITRHRVTGNLVPDAQLAALALENGVAVVSADSDFARFPEVRWVNPLAG
jgi:toxin-antitoxin system PIN domain toxin